jgi:hypothetical protein
VVLGLLAIVRTASEGGGPTALGFIVGVGLVVAGSLRIWLLRRAG